MMMMMMIASSSSSLTTTTTAWRRSAPPRGDRRRAKGGQKGGVTRSTTNRTRGFSSSVLNRRRRCDTIATAASTNNNDNNDTAATAATGNDRYEEKTGPGTLNNTNDSQRRSRRFGASSSSKSASDTNNIKGSVTTKSTRELASTLANRDKNVVLLVETTNCRYCEQVEPTFAAMAAMFAGDESIEVQRVVCKTPEQKAFAGKYFRARSFPTICTLPRGSGPLFRHASSDRSIGAILEFTRETTGAVPNAGKSERYADDLTRRNDWLRQIQQGGLESTTSMAGSYESSMFDDRRGSGNGTVSYTHLTLPTKA